MKTIKSFWLAIVLAICFPVFLWGAFPSSLTNAVDGETEILASHLNNMEDKIGIDSSSVTSSLDYMLRHGASINPGHKHTATSGGTGIYSYVVGDLLYASSTTALSKLAGVATGQVIVSGGVGGSPAWSGAPALTTSVTVPTLYGSAVADGDLTIQGTSSATKTTSYVLLQPTGGNVGIGATVFGTSAAKVFGIGSGTAPTTFPADMAQMAVKDQAAGNACFHFYTELGQIIKLYQQTNIALAKTDYTVGDLDTEAEVIAAINTTNTKINAILTILTNNGLMAP